jgi:hypothetical protein
MHTPTKNAPASVDDLKTLLENDIKVKIAGKCSSNFEMPPL